MELAAEAGPAWRPARLLAAFGGSRRGRRRTQYAPSSLQISAAWTQRW